MKKRDRDGLSGHQDDSGFRDDRQVLDQRLVEDRSSGDGLRFAQVLETKRVRRHFAELSFHRTTRHYFR